MMSFKNKFFLLEKNTINIITNNALNNNKIGFKASKNLYFSTKIINVQQQWSNNHNIKFNANHIKNYVDVDNKSNSNVMNSTIHLRICKDDQMQKRWMSHRDMKRKMKKMMKDVDPQKAEEEHGVKNIPKPSTIQYNPLQQAAGQTAEERLQSTVYLGSLQRVVDDYAPPDTHPSIFTKEGIKSRKKAIQNYFVNWYFYYQMKNKNPGNKVDKKNFLMTAEKIYITFNQALAARDEKMLSNITTPEHFNNIKNQLSKKKALPSGMRQEWVGSITSIKMVNLRYVEMEGLKNHFCQMTAKIRSKQRVKLFKEDELVKESDEVSVSENWVFEIIVNKDDSVWRCCGTIN